MSPLPGSVTTSVGSVRASGGFPFTPGLPERHQHLAFGTELDDDAALLVFARKLLELVGGRHARVGHPDVSVPIDMDAVRPHEHAAAKAPDLLARFIEMVDRIGLGAETARRGPRRATVGRPYGLAILVDGHAVGAAPRPFLQRELRPIADDAIRIGAAVDRRNVLRLGLARLPWPSTRQPPQQTHLSRKLTSTSLRSFE